MQKPTRRNPSKFLVSKPDVMDKTDSGSDLLPGSLVHFKNPSIFYISTYPKTTSRTHRDWRRVYEIPKKFQFVRQCLYKLFLVS